MSLISSPKDPKARTPMFRLLCLTSSLLLVHLNACTALTGNDESSGEQPATHDLSPVPAADVAAIIDAYTSECVLADMQRAVVERNGVHNKRLDQLRQNIRNRPLIAYEKRYPFLKVLSCDLGEVHGALNQYSDAAATSEFIFNAGVEVATNARNIAERYILTPGGQLALTFAGPGLLHGGRALFNPRVVIVLLALTLWGSLLM